MSEQLINAFIQIPFVLGLIYLVLKLEDKRQASAALREEVNQKLIDSLLGLIDELTARTTPDKLTSKQLRLLNDYLKENDKL